MPDYRNPTVTEKADAALAVQTLNGLMQKGIRLGFLLTEGLAANLRTNLDAAVDSIRDDAPLLIFGPDGTYLRHVYPADPAGKKPKRRKGQ